jgi:perosamine synthetase
MDKNKLAIFGGQKTIKKKFKKFNTYGKQELFAANKVVKSGILSEFLAKPGNKYYGGKYVKKFEKKFADFFNVKHAISVNSWTSGLICAVGALDPKPGDEIITTPWTMSATAVSILHWNCIPVFADIEKDTFCIDYKSVEEKISKKTIAILSVDIGGQSADIKKLNHIAKKYNLKIISDSAQAIGAKINGKYAGTQTDIGGFSFNYHKHIHTGEGGMLVTNNNKLAEKMRLLRNHAEGAILNKKIKNYFNYRGYNFRLGEIESAIGLEQLKKLKLIIKNRCLIVKKINKNFKKLENLIVPKVRENCTHIYYVYKIKIKENNVVTKDQIYKALIAEGVPNLSSQYGNIHFLPIFKKNLKQNKFPFPWSLNKERINFYKKNYDSGSCPVAENLNKKEFIGFEICQNELNSKDLSLFISAFKKVWKYYFDKN